MSLLRRWRVRTFALLFFVITFTTFLFSYTWWDPSLYFFKYASRLSDNFFAKGSCACQQCMTELEDDPWFVERFNQSIHPLMSKENSALSDDTFKWWQVRETSWTCLTMNTQGKTKTYSEYIQVVQQIYYIYAYIKQIILKLYLVNKRAPINIINQNRSKVLKVTVT